MPENLRLIRTRTAIICYCVLVGFFRSPSGYALGKQTVVAAISLWTIAGWVTGIMSPAMIGLMGVLGLVVADAMTFQEAVQCFGHTTLAQVLCVMFIVQSIRRTGIGRRIALAILRLAGGHTRLTVLSMILATYLLAFVIPSAVGRMGLLLPIVGGLCKEFHDRGFEKQSLIGVTYASMISITNSITGAAGTVHAAQLFAEHTGMRWTYGMWTAAFAPLNLLILFAVWILLGVVFPVSCARLPRGKDYISSQICMLGPMKVNEYKIVCAVALMVFAWVTEPVHGLPIGLTAGMGALCTMLPGIGVMEWDDGLRGVDWGTLLLFGSSLTVAQAIITSGLHVTVAQGVAQRLVDKRVGTIGLATILLVMAIRFVLNDFNAVVAAALPIAFSIGEGVSIDPVWLGMLVMPVSMVALCFPSQSVVMLTTFSTGRLSLSDVRRIGILSTCVIVLLVLAYSLWVWPCMGIATAM